MASNNIDFVIGAKNNAKPAMESVERSLERLEQKTESLGAATSNLSLLAGGLTAAYGVLKASMGLVDVVERINEAYDESAGATSVVAQMNQKASESLDKLMVSVGTLLAPVRVLVSAGIDALSNALSTLLVPAVEYANSALEHIGPMMDWVAEKVVAGINLMIGAFTWLEVEFTNLDKIWNLWVMGAELAMVKTIDIIAHALTEVIPAYAEWFGENFVNLMTDAMNLAVTVVTNHVTKLVDTFAALWEFIESGGSSDVLGKLGEISGRSYLEGFQSSLSELPNIASRAISDREKQLQDSIGTIAGELGDEFTKKFESRMIRIGDTVNTTIAKDIDTKMTKADAAQPGKKSGGGIQSLSASESRLLTRGSGNSLEEKMIQETKQQSAILQRTGDVARETLNEIRAANRQNKEQLQLVPVT